jgi:hypothetical protein
VTVTALPRAKGGRRPPRKVGPTFIKGVRIVRIRSDYPDIGPFKLHMFIVTDLDDRKRIGHRHISREAAARWVRQQGWRYIGLQEHVDDPDGGQAA